MKLRRIGPGSVFGVTLLAALACALISGAPARAQTVDYCAFDGEATGAHDWCWEGHPPHLHNWDSNTAAYTGGGTFEYCVALKYSNGSHIVASPRCTRPDISSFIRLYFCNTGAGTPLYAAVGNRDDAAHNIYAEGTIIYGCY